MLRNLQGSLRALKKNFVLKNCSNFFPLDIWQMMTFLNHLNELIPKFPFSVFADFWVWVTSEARGSVSVGFRRSRQFSPFGVGVRPEGSIDPPLPEVTARPPQKWVPYNKVK